MNEKAILAHDQELLVKDFWKTIVLTHNVGKSRERRNVIFRHSFFVSTRELTNLSLAAIGKMLGKDHATVLHAIKHHKANYTYDPLYRNIYDDLYASMAEMIHGHNEDIYNAIENRMKNLDLDMFNDEMIKMYKKKLETQREQFELQVDSLKRDVSRLKKQLRTTQERAEFLNKEALRYKNLV